MRKLTRVLIKTLNLALKNFLTIVFSSNAVIVLYCTEVGGIRFFVAKKIGEGPLGKIRGRRYFWVRLEDSPIRGGHLVRIEGDEGLLYYYCYLDKALRMPVQVVPARLSLWLALLWRASLLLVI